MSLSLRYIALARAAIRWRNLRRLSRAPDARPLRPYEWETAEDLLEEAIDALEKENDILLRAEWAREDERAETR